MKELTIPATIPMQAGFPDIAIQFYSFPDPEWSGEDDEGEYLIECRALAIRYGKLYRGSDFLGSCFEESPGPYAGDMIEGAISALRAQLPRMPHDIRSPLGNCHEHRKQGTPELSHRGKTRY